MPTSGSTLFTASAGQRLRVASGAQMVAAAGQAMMFGGWFKFTSLASHQYLITKGNWAGAPASQEYFAHYHNAVPGVSATCSNGTTAASSGYDNNPVLTAGGWHFLIAWYDPASSGTMNMQIDNGTVLSAAATAGIAPNTSIPLTLGANTDNTGPLDAAVNSAFAIQRATAFTAAERAWLYNSGFGRIAADLGQAGTNGANLIPATGKGDWWDLNDNNNDHTGNFNGIVLASPDAGGPLTPTHLSTGIPRYTGSPPPPTVAFGASSAYFSGYWTGSSTSGQTTIAANGFDSTCEFSATGTACTINVAMSNNGGGEAECQVDGGTWTPLVPSAYGTFNATAPIFAGLADAAHSVKVRGKVGPFFKFAPGAGVGSDLTAGIINVTGNSPACAPPSGFASSGNYLLGPTSNDATGQVGAGAKVRLESGYATATSAAGYTPIPKPVNYALGSDGSESVSPQGAQIRFRATTPRVDLWIKNDGQAYGLIVDGVVPINRVVTPTTNRWGWVTLRAGLDGAAEHTYGVICSELNPADVSAGSGEVWAVRTPGGTMNTTAAPALRPTINFFGDSITGGQEPLTAGPAGSDEREAMQGWVIRTAERLGSQFVNTGIGSTTLHDFTGSLGTLAAGFQKYVTKLSGEARASHDVVSLTPAATRVVMMYGRNDVGQAWFSSGNTVESVAQFQSSFTNAINTINAGLPTADIHVIGSMPVAAGVPQYYSGYSETDRVAFNNAIKSVLAGLANPRNHYVDPDRWGLAGPPGDPTGTDFSLTTLDHLHPNRNGRELVHQGLYNAVTGTPTIGIVPVLAYPSTAYTLRLTGNGTAWTTSHALTASAGTLGTPTVDADGYIRVGYTAPSTAQSVTITDAGSGATGTLNVVVPALTLTPSSAPAGSSVTLALTAPFAAWTAAGQSALFTSPGLNLTGAAVAQIGTASVTFTVPNTPGTPVVITDTSTGQTASLAVAGPAPATAYALAGPAGGIAGVASASFTVTPNGTSGGTVTPASTGAGTFTPASLSWSGDSAARAFTYTPASSSGSPHSISISSSPALAYSGSPIAYAVSPAPATAYALAGPAGGIAGVASASFTVTPNGTSGGTVTPASTGAGTFTPASLSWSGDSAARAFTYTPASSSGSPHSISISSSPALAYSGSPIAYAVAKKPINRWFPGLARPR